MFENILNKYKIKGKFNFKQFESLEAKCNAPNDKSGIYLIYKIVDSTETLIYIGSSGQNKNGELKTRKSGLGGMRDRLVNGYHPKFGKVKRKKAFPNQMKIENITEINIYWWVTFNNENSDFPTDVEDKLMNEYLSEFGKRPEWHT